MREKIFEIIEENNSSNIYSKIYDAFMLVVILSSVVPLAFKDDLLLFSVIDKATVAIFIIDYILKISTADLKLKKGRKSFALYPATPLAIVDLISILPGLSLINKSFKLLRLFRLLKTLKIFRAIRYSKTINLLVNVFRRERRALLTVCCFALIYILVAALIVINIEPETFNTYFDALYWATVSLTTVGYGDIYPLTVAGKIMTMVSSLFGIAIIALPSGIITAGFVEELRGKGAD